MFKNEYQGGPFVEIFSAQGKNPGAKWKIFGSPSVIGKEFDKEVKGFVFVLEGSSQTNKMQLPKEMRQNLGLIQQFLVLQIYVPLGQDFSTELLITDLGNIKRRLYLSTVHKELSVTPLHAKIPLFMIKRKIWCNLCIDLVEFTSEIFKGAVYQSLDGIIVSANCKLRKIFTLKSKPLDTADEDVDGPTDSIPRTCQLNSDVPQITQLLNMNKLRLSDQKCGSRPFTSTGSVADEWIFHNKESSQLDSGNRSLVAPETSCGFLTSALSEDQAQESKQTSEEEHEDVFTFSSKPRSAPHGKPLNLSSESCSFSVDLKEESSASWRGAQMEDDFYGSESSKEDDSYSEFEQEVPNVQTKHFISRSSEPVITKEIPLKMMSTSPEHWANKQYSKQGSEEDLPARSGNLAAVTEKADNSQRGFLPVPCLCLTRSIPESCKGISDRGVSSGPLRTSISRKSLKEIPNDHSNPEVQNQEYNWRNYQPGNMSASELQMLASMKRQQNEELENSEPSHGLSASQIDNCNISISTSSDDTTTWNSCRPAPINQGCHYQKEMTPLSHSNPRLLRRAPAPDEWHPPPSMPVPIYIDKDTHYEVNQILDSRLHKGRLQYLVDWKDFPSGDKEWVEAGNVKAPRLLRAFHRAFPDCPRPVDAG
ncbi:protein CFAP20DC isoform X5 [Paroedura picta]|uniref:protein CFAP20DC isoform X5 n=1 Tax=Paroedura picta TaxID=143630 RepID=UPI004056D56C